MIGKYPPQAGQAQPDLSTVPTLPEAMSPEQYVTWLSGVQAMVGEEVPTAEQWARIRDMTERVMGRVIAQKMLQGYLAPYANAHELAMDKLQHMTEQVYKEPQPIRLVDVVTACHTGTASGSTSL